MLKMLVWSKRQRALELFIGYRVITHSFVQGEVIRLHGRTQDFDEGDLMHRLDRFIRFEEMPIALSSIDLNEFSLDEDLVQQFMQEFQRSGSYPPIVFDAVDSSMIDGLHRANALSRMGLCAIDAYVGTAENVDIDWVAESDGDGGDDDGGNDGHEPCGN